MRKASENILMILSLTALFMVSGYPIFSQPQQQPTLSDFTIRIQPTEDGVKLTCESGCTWKVLELAIKPYNRQAINQDGVTAVPSDEAAGDLTAGFLITVQKTNEGFSFEGIKGTSWVKAAGHCSRPGCRQYIGESGIWEETL